MKIPIKKYIEDFSLPWELKYKKLETHHNEETQYMIEEIKKLEATTPLEQQFEELLSRMNILTSQLEDLKFEVQQLKENSDLRWQNNDSDYWRNSDCGF
jgi:predicted RNase H-like nuclease (RuvC/YqgF family)